LQVLARVSLSVGDPLHSSRDPDPASKRQLSEPSLPYSSPSCYRALAFWTSYLHCAEARLLIGSSYQVQDRVAAVHAGRKRSAVDNRLRKSKPWSDFFATGPMLVSFRNHGAVACSLSRIYRVIRALYRVIDTRYRGSDAFEYCFSPLAPAEVAGMRGTIRLSD